MLLNGEILPLRYLNFIPEGQFWFGLAIHLETVFTQGIGFLMIIEVMYVNHNHVKVHGGNKLRICSRDRKN